MPALPPPPPAISPIGDKSHIFQLPEKKIESQEDLTFFESSLAFVRITSFLQHLNKCVSPLAANEYENLVDTFSQGNSSNSSKPKFVQGIIDLITTLEDIVTECPPETGPRRFGNAAFRSWHKLATERITSTLLDTHLPSYTRNPPPPQTCTAKAELGVYLLGSFGSPQRLDFGTGHELSFLAFLCGIWLLDGFRIGDERALVLRLIPAYLRLIRTLVTSYTLEPAGSHGVWGLDDHFFLPYIFGSAQLTTQAPQPGVEPDYRSIGVPRPGDITKLQVVDDWRERNLYFGAVGFIYDVKSGPFWEHSPILFDISGVREGWGKINIGMMKMYHAEVLGKFPVVQHFYFGSLFPWVSVDKSVDPLPSSSTSTTTTPTPTPTSITTQPLSQHQPSTAALPTTRAPWTAGQTQTQTQSTRAPWVGGSRGGPPPPPPPPQAQFRGQIPPPPPPPGGEGVVDRGGAATRAPWAR
ncbi:phosphotyrosyl phosphatase activator [Peziza echinospora]|nr:phosphotyrosyl phosphatase activator [Peziza echinospora]